MTRLVQIGAVTKPHGIRGEVRVHLFNPDSDLLLDREQVWLCKDGEAPRAITVLTARRHGKGLLLTFEGVADRSAAEALRGLEVGVPRDELPTPEEDEFYHFDLEGLRVVTADGEEVGEVVEVLTYPASDCLLVRGGGIDREVPVLRPYVENVDLEAGQITVAFLDDLDTRRSPQ